jgi:hypothetical protein
LARSGIHLAKGDFFLMKTKTIRLLLNIIIIIFAIIILYLFKEIYDKYEESVSRLFWISIFIQSLVLFFTTISKTHFSAISLIINRSA